MVVVVDWKKVETEHGPPVQRRFGAQKIALELDPTGYLQVHTDLSIRNHSMVRAPPVPVRCDNMAE